MNTTAAPPSLRTSATTANTASASTPSSSSSASTSAALLIQELNSISSNNNLQPTPTLFGRDSVVSPPSTSRPHTTPAQQVEPNRCYICFGTDEDSVGRWVHPCQCTLVSHEDCLLDWIDKNRAQFARKQVRCSVCNTVYRIEEPLSIPLYFYHTFDSLVHAAIPYMTFLGLTCSVLITSTTYGAYAVLAICGTEQGERLLGSPEPWSWRVWTGLPMIPGLLVLSRTTLIDSIIPLIPLLIVGNEHLQVSFPPSPALTISLLPWVRMAYNGLWGGLAARLEAKWRRDKQRATGVAGLGMSASIESEEEQEGIGREDESGNSMTARQQAAAIAADALAQEGEEEESFFDRKDLGRMIAGALLLPAISSICGGLLGRIGFIKIRVPDAFHRNILGGCLFVLLKDLASLYGTYQQLKRRRIRRIREFSEFKDEVLR